MTHRSYACRYLRHGVVSCIGRLGGHACPSAGTPPARQRPRRGVGAGRGRRPAGIPAGRAARRGRRHHDAPPTDDRDQRDRVAAGGARTRDVPNGRGRRGRLPAAAAAVDRRHRQPAPGPWLPDPHAFAGGRVPVAPGVAGDESLRGLRPSDGSMRAPPFGPGAWPWGPSPRSRSPWSPARPSPERRSRTRSRCGTGRSRLRHRDSVRPTPRPSCHPAMGL